MSSWVTTWSAKAEADKTFFFSLEIISIQKQQKISNHEALSYISAPVWQFKDFTNTESFTLKSANLAEPL